MVAMNSIVAEGKLERSELSDDLEEKRRRRAASSSGLGSLPCASSSEEETKGKAALAPA